MAQSHKRPSARRVAALADVHANVPALAAVLDEVVLEAPDLVAFCGDLTWGSLPRETLELVRELSIPARFVRGNGDRAVGTLRDGRGAWMATAHASEDAAFLAGFEPTESSSGAPTTTSRLRSHGCGRPATLVSRPSSS